MADGSTFPVFLKLQYERGNAFPEMQADLDRGLGEAERRFKEFANVSEAMLDQAMGRRRTAGGGLDINVAGQREAARVAQERAQAAKELATATRLAAQAAGDESRSARLAIAAAEAQAVAERQAAAAALSRAEAAEQLQVQLNRLAPVNDNLARSMAAGNRAALDTITATGAQRAGLQQLGYQLSDVATMWALGARPAQIFASQIGQVCSANRALVGHAKATA